jgi:hypothetical protein
MHDSWLAKQKNRLSYPKALADYSFSTLTICLTVIIVRLRKSVEGQSKRPARDDFSARDFAARNASI